MRHIILVVLVVLPSFSSAQLLDSIALFLKERPRIVAKLDMRGSFVSNQNVRLMGAKLGLEYARRFQYGIGYSFLFTPIEQERYINADLGTRTTRLRIGYITPYVDYAFYQRKNWEVRIPVQLGFGSGSLVYEDDGGRKQKWVSTGLILYEPAMTVQYRFLNYFALAAGWGYRLVFYTRSGLDERIGAPTYTFGLRVFLGDIRRDLWGAMSSPRNSSQGSSSGTIASR